MVTIAMWSGPRNLSTAMMRSFGSRSDCTVWDEPFYAAYLVRTGIAHPMAAQVTQAYETDPAVIAERCLAKVDAPVFYQKHMTHHMIDDFQRAWITGVENVFLIREPARVVASYHAKRELPAFDDLGFRQQNELFDQVTQAHGQTPIVIDAADISRDPQGMLTKLCQKLGIAFDPAMLSWAAGPRPEDGLWGQHWYNAVWQSTGFAPLTVDPVPPLPEPLEAIVEIAQRYYQKLAQYRLS